MVLATQTRTRRSSASTRTRTPAPSASAPESNLDWRTQVTARRAFFAGLLAAAVRDAQGKTEPGLDPEVGMAIKLHAQVFLRSPTAREVIEFMEEWGIPLDRFDRVVREVDRDNW